VHGAGTPGATAPSISIEEARPAGALRRSYAKRSSMPTL
jgi:hypothetical protein